MKSFRKLLLTIPFVAMFLSGCVAKTHVEVSESESVASEVISSEESSEEISVEESSEEEVSSEELSTEESSEEESQEESSEAPAFTVQGVMEDICIGIFGEAVLDDNYWSDGQGGFYTGVGFGSYGEEYLALAVNTVIGMLPDYCVEVTATHTDTWEDGSNGAFALFATEDGAVGIEIGSYVYNAKLYAQINVF